MLKYLKILLGFSLVIFLNISQAGHISSCPILDGNVDVYTRIIDFRSKPAENRQDFESIVEAMKTGGKGKLIGICVEAHSNIKNSEQSTLEEARRFSRKMCRANVVAGVPIYIYGHGNKVPSSDFWINQNKDNAMSYNHRIEVKYVYACPDNISCVAPLSKIKINPNKRVNYGAGVCTDSVPEEITLKQVAINTANHTEKVANEMLHVVNELLKNGLRNQKQKRLVHGLHKEAKSALKIVKDIRKSLPNMKNIILRPNCPEQEVVPVEVQKEVQANQVNNNEFKN